MPEPPQSVEAHRNVDMGCPREDKELLPRSQLYHQGKRQYMMVIITVCLESLWAYPESCAADDS